MKVNLQDQLINQLTNYIQTLKTNDKLPSERQLAQEYQVSRNTVRLALLNLESTGLVRRIHGKGTFVNRMNLDSDLGDSYKFGQQMRLLGKTPSTEIIDFEKKEVNAFFAKNLHLEVGAKMFKVDRLRLADGEPMMFERSFLPCDIFQGLTKEMLINKSMYDVFQDDFGEKISYADEYFSAGVIGSCDSKIMRLSEGTPCLHLKRQTYDSKHRVIEFTLSVARSDEFAYHVRHHVED